MEKTYKYLGYFLLILVPLTFLGFLKTYFIQFPNFNENINVFTHLHAFIATVWVLLLIVQPILIKNRKNAAHKTIGKITYLLFPLLILSFVPLIINILHSENQKFSFFPISDSILLVLFYSLAIYNKNNVAYHMRFMIGISFVFIGPTFGRIGKLFLGLSQEVTQHITYGIIYFLLIGLIYYDRKNRRNYQPYIFLLSVWVIHLITFYIMF